MDSAQALGEPAPPSELERLRRRNDELQILYETIRDVTSTLAVEQVLERLLERTLCHLSAEIGSILLMASDSRLRIFAARGLPEHVVKETEMSLGQGISGFVAESGRSLIVRDVERDDRFRRRNHERYYTRSLISAPVILNDTVMGVLNVNNKCNRETFGDDDLNLLEAIAGHAAVGISNARQYEETLKRAQRDALTGLAHHGHFYEALEREVERAQRYGRELALVMLDIDRFKSYNDRFGHRAGDEALVQVARTISADSRAHDLVARYGGEEFAVILPETSLGGAVAFAEKLRESVARAGFGADGSEELTASIGVAAGRHEGESAAALVEAADEQLYRAKAGGRNRVCAVGGARVG